MKAETKSPTDGHQSENCSADYCHGGFQPDDIIITGMAGRFPWSDNVEELKNKLYNKDIFFLPTEKRWAAGSAGLPFTESAIINEIGHFDANFFKIPYILARTIEPVQRILLEVSHEAICDAGYNPFEFRGKNIGVYCAMTQSDFRELYFSSISAKEYDSIGYMNALLANRISYCFDFKGPSYTIDAQHASSAEALDVAISDLKEGRIDGAVVAAGQLTGNPEVTKAYAEFGFCSIDRECYPFDARAKGNLRSEAIVGLFIQRASAARRCYAQILNSNCYTVGCSPEGLFLPSKTALEELYLQAINDCNLQPLDIGFVEAHGLGTIAGDAIELDSIADVYCKERKKPLLVGTLKSNLGNSEAASTLCGLVKCIFALENGMIAPNLNYEKPNPSCSSLLDGRLKVVTESTELTSSHVAVNTLGFGGLNSHVILKKNPIEPIKHKKKFIPELLLYSATTEEAVKDMINYVQSTELPKEFFTLLTNIAYTPVLHKPYRGYAVLCDNPTSEIELCNEERREIWYVLTGMGCQWPGMGTSLMEIDIFAKSIRRSAKTLEPFGVDLLELMKPHTNHLSQTRKITPAFVAICAIQIALIDILRELGIEPDGMVGHSTGELVCAYADGCCTAEQTITSAYLRGKAVESANLPCGAMAAVGITWNEAKEICPENVHAACHNAQDSITISGLEEPLKKFVTKLEKEGRFARVVDAYGYAFHCAEVSPASPALKSELLKVITHPKKRSSRWLSTSYTPDQWDLPEANIADASYFTHNLISTVHFAEALARIPSNAITIEIGPHFLLQSILKRVIGNNAIYFGLMKRHENNVNFLLNTVGKLYKCGLNPKIGCLYSRPSYPVPRGTPSISNLIKWDHLITWPYPKYTKRTFDLKTIVHPDGSEQYLLDYCIGGRVLYPAMGYVWIAWKAFAREMLKSISQLSITVEDFKVHAPAVLSATEEKMFSCSISKTTGKFFISENDLCVASGKISSPSKHSFDLSIQEHHSLENTEVISGDELYSALKVRGYEYGPHFQNLLEADIKGTQGMIEWNDKWIPFLHAHLLFFESFHDHTLNVPVGATSIHIDPVKVMKAFHDQQNEGLKGLPVTFEKYLQRCCSPGIEIRKLQLEPVLSQYNIRSQPIFEAHDFIPYVQTCAISEDLRQQCIEYIDVCNKLACTMASDFEYNLNKKLKEHITKEVSSEIVNAYLNAENGNYILLQILSEVADSPSLYKEGSNFFGNYVKDIIRTDFLYSVLLNEHVLRSVVEIIVENSNRRLNVTEVHDSFPPMLPLVRNIMTKFYNCQVNCTLLCSETAVVDADALNMEKVKVQCISSNENQSFGNQNVILSSFIFGDAKAFQVRIKQLCSLASNESHILLYYKRFTLPVEMFLNHLTNGALVTLSEPEMEKCLNAENVIVIAKKEDSFGGALYLLCPRRKLSLPSSDIIVNIMDGHCDQWLNQLKLSMLSATSKVWLVADSSPINGIMGLVKCLRQEPGGEKIRCVYVFKNERLAAVPPFDLKNPFYAEVAMRDVLMNIYRDGTWGSYQHYEISKCIGEKVFEHSFLNCERYGDVSSLKWTESPIRHQAKLSGSLNVARVYYSAINYRDVMLVSGKLSYIFSEGKHKNADSYQLGIEFSGVTTKGHRVMGLVPNQAMSTTVELDNAVLLDVPDSWSLEDAATVPYAYCTSYYALIVKGRLQKKSSVLIHSGTDDIGIAAIRIALGLECEVFVTVSTNEKKQYLNKKFPQISNVYLEFSEDVLFEELILSQTKGKGVDVILNSLNKEHLFRSTRCMAENGHFLTIEKSDCEANQPFGLYFFIKNTMATGVFLGQLLNPDEFSRRKLKEVVKLCEEGIHSGVVQPIERIVFGHNDVENAFRYFAPKKHIGKVIIKIQDEESIAKSTELKAKPALYFYKHKSYIIIGGIGSFGLELVEWMLKKGARNIVITSRYGVRTPYQRLCLLRWESEGADIQVSTLNTSKKEEAIHLLKKAASMGPIGGIFNCAVLLREGFIENQTPEYFEESCTPKSYATKTLDDLSRIMCPQLDYFVCFSCVSSGKGIAGLSSDAYTNSSMERICENRQKNGIHGLAIQFGVIADVGIYARSMGENAVIEGIFPQKISAYLASVEHFLLSKKPVVSSYAIPVDQRKTKYNQNDVLQQLAEIFGFRDISEMNMDLNLKEFGVDPIVSSGLRTFLEFSHGIIFSEEKLLKSNVKDLLTLIKTESLILRIPSCDEKAATTKIFIPKTVISKTPMLPLNSQKSGIPLFIIHHSEIELTKWQTLAEELNVPVWGLTPTKDISVKSIEIMAGSCLQEICKYYSKCHIIGLSSGSNLAFEMALQSQNNADIYPRIKSLIFLEASSHFINGWLEYQESNFTSENEVSDLYEFLMQFSTSDLPLVKAELQKKKDSASRMWFIVKLLCISKLKKSLSKKDITEAICFHKNVLELSRKYRPGTKLISDVTLIESSGHLYPNDVALVKSALSQNCSGEISICRMVGEKKILDDKEVITRVANLINKIVGIPTVQFK